MDPQKKIEKSETDTEKKKRVEREKKSRNRFLFFESIMLRFVVVIVWMVMLASGQLRGTLRSHYVRRFLLFFESRALRMKTYTQTYTITERTSSG